MRRPLIFLLLLTTFLSCTSCREDIPVGPSGTVELSLKTVFGDEPFQNNKVYDYPSGGAIQFENLSLFLSDISLIAANGQDEVMLDDINYIDIQSLQYDQASANIGWAKVFHSIPLGDYKGIKFSLGVRQEENNLQPSDFAQESPLGNANRYSSEFGSYIFGNIQGLYHQDGSTTKFAIQTLQDQMYREVILSKVFSISDSNNELGVTFDLKEVFRQNDSILDISANSNIIAPSSPYMEWISNNLQQSFSY